MSNLEKVKPVRSKQYLQWVASLPCSICDNPQTVAHHLIGVGQGCMGGKSSDLMTMPLCVKHHQGLHHYGKHKDLQYEFIAKTLATAIAADCEALNTISL